MSIDWYAIHWQALSTFAAGLMAVGGAAFIATRQMAITRRQADISDRQAGIQEKQVSIQKRQVQLQHLNLRIQLFERRLAVYVRTAEFISQAAVQRKRLSIEEENSFLRAAGESKFLFQQSVHDKLFQVWEKYDKLREARKTDPVDDAEVAELMKWFSQQAAYIGGEFVEEMMLTDISKFDGEDD